MNRPSDTAIIQARAGHARTPEEQAATKRYAAALTRQARAKRELTRADAAVKAAMDAEMDAMRNACEDDLCRHGRLGTCDDCAEQAQIASDEAYCGGDGPVPLLVQQQEAQRLK